MGKIIIVAGDGTGNYNCDGIDDHIQINQALKFVHDNEDYDTVHLKGAFRYVIDSSLLIYSNTILEGDKDAVLTIKDNNGWGLQVPLIKQANATEKTKGTITFRGFQIDGNADGNQPNGSERRGDGFHNFMLIYYDNVEVYNMYLHDSLGDGLKVKYSNSVYFYNNTVYNLGHDVVFADESNNVRFTHNNVKTMTNSAIRLYNSNGKIDDNEIWTEYGSDAGGPGIQIQYIKESGDPDPMDNIEICGNYIHDTYGPGIWIVGIGAAYSKDEAKNIYIHDNQFIGCGTHPLINWLGGIVLSGFYDTVIENNYFDGNYHAAIVFMYPDDNRFSGLAPTGTSKPYTTYVKGNQICRTKLRKGTCGGTVCPDPKTTGQGIINYYPDIAKIVSDNNYIWDNAGGAYKNVTSTTDILYSPDKNHDNRLKQSTSYGSYGVSSFNDVGGIGSNGYRDLIYFDLAEYTDVGKAILSLLWYYPNNTRINDTIVEVYRPASSWDSGFVSWDKKDEYTDWDNVGSDWYDKEGVPQGSTPYATFTIDGSALPDNKYHELDVTDLVKEYVDGTYWNTGFLIKASIENDNYIAFYSLNSQKPPKLTVTKKQEIVIEDIVCPDCSGKSWNMKKETTDGISVKKIYCETCGVKYIE